MRLAPLVIAAAAALVSFEASALAAPADPKIEDVTFTDADKLTTSNTAPGTDTLNGRPPAVRTTLTRPRISFVPEMLASIQNL